MPIRIQMHAPAGTARVVLVGGKFGQASCFPTDIPQCKIEKFTDTELVVSSTAPDGDGEPGQFGLNVEVVRDPLSSMTISGQTTGQATLNVQRDGTTKALGTDQPETVLFQDIG